MTEARLERWFRDAELRDARREFVAHHPLTFTFTRATDCTVEEFVRWCDENLTAWLPITLGDAAVISVENPEDAFKLRTRWGCYMGLPRDRFTLHAEP